MRPLRNRQTISEVQLPLRVVVKTRISLLDEGPTNCEDEVYRSGRAKGLGKILRQRDRGCAPKVIEQLSIGCIISAPIEPKIINHARTDRRSRSDGEGLSLEIDAAYSTEGATKGSACSEARGSVVISSKNRQLIADFLIDPDTGCIEGGRV